MNQKFIMLVGLPASGKSVKAKELSDQHNANIHSSDALREELFGSTDVQDKNNLLFQELHRRIKNDLLNGESVIYDATNISYKRRISFLSEIKKYKCSKIVIIMATPYKECLERNETRAKKVPKHVIKKMYMNWNTPYWYEGWDDIQIIYSQYKDRFPYAISYMLKHMNYNQESKHHQLTLGRHLDKTFRYVAYYTPNDLPLGIASALHDCGKPFTKSSVNYKGEETDTSHYYQHHCVGAYDSLFYDTPCNALDYAILIQWHMQPYFWENEDSEKNREKHKNKYKKLWGDELFKDIMLLHKADKLAH